ncbi:MAG: hypothetical protein JJU21_00680 [Salinarimonas sp.]|nr:hypothetical protein [Salinarimonas sp.]
MILLIVHPRSSRLTASKPTLAGALRVAVPSPDPPGAVAASLVFLGGSVAPFPGHPRLARAPWALQTRAHPLRPRRAGGWFMISFPGAARHDHTLETDCGHASMPDEMGQ